MSQPTDQPAAAPSAELSALLRAADAAEWAELLAELDGAQSLWSAALHGPDAASAAALRDGDWTAVDCASHAVNWLRLASAALGNVCVSQPADLPAENFLPGDPDFSRIRRQHERWAEELRMAATTVAKTPDRGAVIGSRLGPLTAKQVVAITSAHLTDHARQLAGMSDRGRTEA